LNLQIHYIRNKAKNALSLATPIYPGMAGAKIGKISFGWRKKKHFFIKTLAGWENVCNFAVSDCRQRARTNCFRSNIQVGPF
jgi:hypothetical protein